MYSVTPFFSIVIPSYNRSSELNKVLSSLSDQTYKNFEAVVIDDCSTEPLVIKNDYPFSANLFRNKNNMGASASRNIGVNHAVGEWIVFLDDDDEFKANKLAELYKITQQDNMLNFIYHKAMCVMVNEEVVYQTAPEKAINKLSVNNMLQTNQLGGTPMHAIKRAYFLSLGGFNMKLKALEDYEFLIRLTNDNNFRPAYLDSVLTVCNFNTKKRSVSKNHLATEEAWNYIENLYKSRLNEDVELNRKLKVNKLNSILYLQVVNLDRKCSVTLLKLFVISYKPLYLLMAMAGLISPKLLIYLRKYKK